jgi:hypothetical protein
MKQGLHTRWDCVNCGCWVWVRQGMENYGTALSAKCSTIVGRGRVSCRACDGWWEWPGTFADEAAARRYIGEHVCGRRNLEVRVIRPAVTGGSDATSAKELSASAHCSTSASDPVPEP